MHYTFTLYFLWQALAYAAVFFLWRYFADVYQELKKWEWFHYLALGASYLPVRYAGGTGRPLLPSALAVCSALCGIFISLKWKAAALISGALALLGLGAQVFAYFFGFGGFPVPLHLFF